MAKTIKKETIHAKGIDIGIYTNDFENEYISLTDIAKYRNEDDPRFVIQNWMRNRNTIEFLGVWEQLHNPDFNRVQFEAVKNEAGLNRFVMTPSKWIEQMNSILKSFDIIYSEFTDAEKKRIKFRFPVYYNGTETQEVDLSDSSWNYQRSLETVVALIRTDGQV